MASKQTSSTTRIVSGNPPAAGNGCQTGKGFWLVIGVALCIYLGTLAPTVTSEDSGELIAAAYCFGVPHPPGYPLWAILCGLFIRLFPFGEIAWRANLFSAVCSCLAAGFVYRCLVLMGLRQLTAAASSLVFATGAILWSQSVITEVYALHILLVAVMLWCGLRWYVTPQARWLVLASLMFGLGMANHHTIGFSAVAGTVWIVWLSPRLLTRWRLVLACVAAFAIGLLPYFYLLVRASADPPINWGDPDTWSKLVDHFNRKQYKGWSPIEEVHPGKPVRECARELGVVADYCQKEYTPYLLPLVAIGLGVCAVRERRYLALTGLLLICNLGIFFKMSGISDDRQGYWTNQVFFLPVYLTMVIPLAFGLESFRTVVEKLFSRFRLPATKAAWLAGGLTASVPVISFAVNLQRNNMSQYYYAYDHAKSMLVSMLPNAMIFPSGDHNTFPLIYLLLVQGQRSDVLLADKYGYIEPALYRDMPGLEGQKPRTRYERDQIEEWLIRHLKRPVYYTVKRQPLVANARMVPSGVIYHLLPEGKEFDAQGPWNGVQYRNLNGLSAPRDYGADNILADIEFFTALRALEQKDKGAALQHFARTTEYGQGIREISNNIGSALAEYGHLAEAMQYYERVCEADKNYEAPRWNLARICKNQNNLQAARQRFEELTKINPKDFRPFGELGFLARRLEEDPNVVKHYWEESLRLNPSQPQIIAELAAFYAPPESKPSPQTQPTSPVASAPAKPAVSPPMPTTQKVAEASPPDANVPVKQSGKLEFAELAWDFGNVRTERDVTHMFKFRNVGPGPVDVTDVHSTCGCTVPSLERKHFDSGDEGQIQVVLKTGPKRGPLQKHLQVRTNVDSQKEIELALSAQVSPPLTVEPERLNLGWAPGETTILREVRIASPDGIAFTAEATVNHPEITLSMNPPEAASEHTLMVMVYPAGLGQDVQATVEIATSHPEAPLLKIPLRVMKVNPLSAQPSLVFFGRIDTSSKVAKTVDLSVKGEGTPVFQVENATEILPVVASIEPLAGGEARRWSLHLSLREDSATKGPFHKVLRLRTGLDSQPMIEIPVYGIIN